MKHVPTARHAVAGQSAGWKLEVRRVDAIKRQNKDSPLEYSDLHRHNLEQDIKLVLKLACCCRTRRQAEAESAALQKLMRMMCLMMCGSGWTPSRMLCDSQAIHYRTGMSIAPQLQTERLR